MEKGPYEEAEALRIAIQIAKALEHAHNAGFMHRDVKPKNIMITKEGVAKLTDLGLARAVSDREAAKAEQGRAFGTPYYISPEQARGRTSIDFRADIYCFGATLYHMVTGQVPFKGPDVDTVMRMHLEDELVPPDHINSKISRGMAEVIEVCMAKRRRDRYANTSDLVADLEALAVGDPPLQARKVFDLSALAPLREEAEAQKMVQIDTAPSVTENPLFLPALLGWLLAVVLAIALILVLVG